mmetsp:Transcript_5079/g.18999  ORF Transcript_5079/g.18999 Transcript_5079/m.18999 type:complete len:208 (-) Transcript_5079:471-1094(-)
MASADYEFSHRKRLCRGGRNDVRQRGVDEEFVSLRDFPRVVRASVESERQFLSRRGFNHILEIVAVAKDVKSQLILRRGRFVVFRDALQEFQVALRPNHLPNEVPSLCETTRLDVRRFRNLSPDADEMWRHAVNVDGYRSRKVLNSSGEFNYLVAVHSRDSSVDASKELLFFLAILLSSRVFQVVRMDDSHDVPELVRPAHAMVKPC